MTINPEHRETLRDLVRDALRAQNNLWDAIRAIEAELDVDLIGLDESIHQAAVCLDGADTLSDESLDSVFSVCEPEEDSHA